MNPKILAIILLAAAGVLFLTAGMLTWGGIDRWRAHGALVEAQDRALAGDAAGARASARTAVDILPSEPAAVLAAADLLTITNVDALAAVARGADATGKAALAAGAGIALGKPPEGMDPNASDLALLQAMAARSAGPVKLSKDAPPHLAVLTSWAAMRLSAALAAKSPTDLYEAASALLTLAPRHPQTAELRLLVAALAPEVTTAQLIAAAAAISDIERRNRLGQHLVAMMPERTSLRILLPGGGDAAAGEAEAVRKLVTAAKLNPASINEGLIIRCLQAGKADAADELVTALPAGPRQADMNKLGDLLDGGSFATSPAHISHWSSIDSTLTFHLSNAAGAIPTRKIGIRVGTIDIPADQIRRLGTLVVVPLKVSGEQDITVTYDGKPVFAAKLTL